jgi:rubrerythrin
MKTDIPVFDLIDQCEFKIADPFDLNARLFPALEQSLPDKLIGTFETKVYKTWLHLGFNGESLVSVFYNIIADRLQQDRYDGYFDHLSDLEVDTIVSDFRSVVEDEERHREIFYAIIKKLDVDIEGYQPDFYDPNNKDYQELVANGITKNVMGEAVDNPTLLDQLTAILTIETYLLATFSMFYKATTNENKKLIFKSFLQDESRHVAHFIRLLKQARIPKEHIDQADRRIILNILDNSNFELIALIKYLRDIVKNKDKQSAIINNVYKDTFHQTFKHIYLTKCWQFYNILHPNVSEQDFVKIIDDFDVLNLEYRGRLQ